MEIFFNSLIVLAWINAALGWITSIIVVIWWWVDAEPETDPISFVLDKLDAKLLAKPDHDKDPDIGLTS